MDPGYDPDFNAALNLVNMALPPADHLPVPAPQPVRQQETVSWPLLLVGKPFGRIFSSCSKKARGRRSMLASAALGLHVVTPLFRTMVRLRLRLPVSDSDTPCPLCEGTCDRFGDHARVCP